MTVPRRLNPWQRLGAALLALACLAVLVVAASVPPRSSGFGTHQTLGLQPCGFLQLTDLPCASCGMTTSFSCFVHGQLLHSFWVQPMGFFLACLTAATFWAGAYIALSGRPAHRLLNRIPLRYYVLFFGGGTLLGWGWKIAIHLLGVDGWNPNAGG